MTSRSPDFRPATARDLECVAGWITSAEECFCWAGNSVVYPVDLKALPERVKLETARSWAMEAVGQLAGFGQLVSRPEEHLHLARLIVHPQERGHGLGRRLTRHLLDDAREQAARTISLNVAPENEIARDLYQDMGFRAPVNRVAGGDGSHEYLVFVPESVRELEAAYFESRGVPRRDLDYWPFCDNEVEATQLARLTLQGEKRATSPSLWWFEANGQALPRVGDAEVVTDWNGHALCVIELTRVEVVPFDEIDAVYARTEGEGDKSLEYWRRVHWDYYERELEGSGRSRAADMPIVCIEFQVALTAPAAPRLLDLTNGSNAG